MRRFYRTSHYSGKKKAFWGSTTFGLFVLFHHSKTSVWALPWFPIASLPVGRYHFIVEIATFRPQAKKMPLTAAASTFSFGLIFCWIGYCLILFALLFSVLSLDCQRVKFFSLPRDLICLSLACLGGELCIIYSSSPLWTLLSFLKYDRWNLMAFLQWLPANAWSIVDIMHRMSISFALSRADSDILFPLAALKQKWKQIPYISIKA